jgi:hypothetical protein
VLVYTLDTRIAWGLDKPSIPGVWRGLFSFTDNDYKTVSPREVQPLIVNAAVTSMTECRNVCWSHQAIVVMLELPYKEFIEINMLQIEAYSYYQMYNRTSLNVFCCCGSINVTWVIVASSTTFPSSSIHYH